MNYSFRRIFRKQDTERRLQSELLFHLEQRETELVASGVPADEARRQAQLEFGGTEAIKEQCRESRRIHFWETLLQDIRYGIRLLRRTPGFTLVALLTLTLGIGANTAIFSVVNGILLNRLPFVDPDRLVVLHESSVIFNQGSISYPNFLDWQKDNTVFSAMAAYRFTAMSLTGNGQAEQLRGEMVSAGLFSLLGVAPVLGRDFTPDDDHQGAAPVVLISEGLWRRRFNSSPSIAGTQITLDGSGYTIVGVIPGSFHLSLVNFRNGDIYTPVGQWNNRGFMSRAGAFGLRAFARLKPGVSVAQARSEMDRICANLARAWPDANTGVGAKVVPLKQQIIGPIQPLLLMLLCAVGLVLLIACVNVANLLLARSTVRMREFTVRSALGATSKRIVRQLLTETVLLGLGGGLLGLLLALLVTRLAVKVPNLPRAGEIRIDSHVLLFALGISLLAGILFGLVPAFRISRFGEQSQLRETGRGTISGRHRTQGIFAGLQVALALMLLISAGLLLRSVYHLLRVDPGFNPNHVVGFDLTLAPSVQKESPDAIRAALRQIEDRLAQIPGVESAAMGWASFPLANDSELQFWLDGQPRPATESDMQSAIWYEVTPGYFQTMGIRLLKGRLFTSDDIHSSMPVIVVDEAFAGSFFPHQNPLGRRIHLDQPDRIAEIIGVVRHVKHWGLDADENHSLQAQMYTSGWQKPESDLPRLAAGMGVVLRSQLPPSSVYQAARQAMSGMNSQYVISEEQTMNELLAESIATRRVSMLLIASFAALALVLASIGIYGVIAYTVSQRTQEIGIRMALGASRRNVTGMVLRQGAAMALGGVAAGILASFALTRFLSGQLYHVATIDPLTFTTVPAVLFSIALLACYIPAARAARVDPNIALRRE